ncbi:MAG: class I SAM-dependent methyltransferase [Thermoplasmata archaeon]
MDANPPARLTSTEFVAGLTGTSNAVEEYVSVVDALYAELVLRVGMLYGYDGKGRSPSVIDPGDARVLYSLCRILRPSTVIETGVSDGVSSAVILSALESNDEGKLISIDFPLVGIPRLYGKQPGWVVPDRLRDRWTLFKGQSRKLLPSVLLRYGPPDIFFHDSEHSYDCMHREFVTTMRSLGPGGTVLCDDGWVSSAMRDAANEVFNGGRSVLFTVEGMAGVRMPRPMDRAPSATALAPNWYPSSN